MESSVTVVLLFLLFAEPQLTQSQPGYPLASFGPDSGDALVPISLDGSGPPINFTTPFPYFGTDETVIFVNTNGILSFGSEYHEWVPELFSSSVPVVIAPFWDDVDIRRFGNIYYRRVTAGTEFLKLQEIITITFNTTGFEIRELFVATYHKVAGYDFHFDFTFYYNFDFDTESNSFQAVLATDGQKSFVFFSYGSIEWEYGANIGFNSDNISYTLPGALTNSTLDIEDSSNVGVPGLYVYRVDQESIILPSQEICQEEGRPEFGLNRSGSGSGQGLSSGSGQGSGSGLGLGSGSGELPIEGLPQPILYNLGSCQVEVTITSSKDPPVLLGDYLVLTCMVEGTSNTEFLFNWWHQDMRLPNETTPTLVLPLVTRRELGVYMCTVRNSTVIGTSFINITSQATGAIPPGAQVSSDCPSQSTRDTITRDAVQYLVQHGARPYGRLRTFPAASCQEISHAHPELGAGVYWISEDGGEPTETYCDI